MTGPGPSYSRVPQFQITHERLDSCRDRGGLCVRRQASAQIGQVGGSRTLYQSVTGSCVISLHHAPENGAECRMCAGHFLFTKQVHRSLCVLSKSGRHGGSRTRTLLRARPSQDRAVTGSATCRALKLVPVEGVAPPILAAAVSETAVYAIPPYGQKIRNADQGTKCGTQERWNGVRTQHLDPIHLIRVHQCSSVVKLVRRPARLRALRF